MFLVVSVPLLPSTSLLQELTDLVISRQESFNHSFPALLLLLKFLTTPFNDTSFNLRPQVYLSFKARFSSNEARNVTNFCTWTADFNCFSGKLQFSLHILQITHTHYLYTAP